MKIYKFVITGGPCGGKTTALERFKSELEKSGFDVLTISETATELQNGNIQSTVPDFQKHIFRLQLEKESIYNIVAESKQKDTVIIMDRCLIDGNAYINNDEFNNIAESFGFTKDKLYSRYDAVFHLVTAADGAEEYYTLANNTARTESPETAREIDKKTYDVSNNHPHFYYYDNSTDFKTKIDRCVADMIEYINNNH